MEKYNGIIPAFYACYEDDGAISETRTKALVRWLADRNVRGLYLCGSSGECIYQSAEERMQILEWVMEEPASEDLVIIAHVAANSVAESQQLAEHAETKGVDAIAAIPPIYFKLPDKSMASYWNAISQAAPQTDFFIYNIPQLAGVALTPALLTEMLKNPKLVGVKNSSISVQDIEQFCQVGGEDFVVLNGPDEQYLAGRTMGAKGGIGGTYAVMPELFIEIDHLMAQNKMETARKLQYAVNSIIYKVLECQGNLYAGMKEILKRQGVTVGTVREPLALLTAEDDPIIEQACAMIEEAKEMFLS